MFDIRLNEQQLAFRNLAREFADNEIKPRALELDKLPNWEDRIPRETLKKGSQLGFRTFALQEKNGGAGASDHLTACLVAEELAAADIGTAYYFMLTARRARDWFELRMTDQQREYFLPQFLNDDFYFTTVAIHEPDTDLGFDYYTETPPTARFKTRATEQPDGSWIINGAKNFQTVGYMAKLLVTMAQTDAGRARSSSRATRPASFATRCRRSGAGSATTRRSSSTTCAYRRAASSGRRRRGAPTRAPTSPSPR